MNNFIKHFPSKFIIILARVTSIFSPKRLMILPLTLIMVILPSFAIEHESTNIKVMQSYSSGQLVSSSDSESAEKILKALNERVLLKDSDQQKSKANKKTRNITTIPSLNVTGRNSTNINKTNISITSKSFSNGNFVIYDGYAQLIEDYDEDGYFQTFSVTFDADLLTGNIHDEAVVYAELYLSENGGPWLHYYSTDSFVIHGESSADEFEVYSTLAQGFVTNQYDVLIDLYEEGYPNIIASYSSNDSNSLYALPLESSDYDQIYEDSYSQDYYTEEHIHAGSYSVYLILIMVLAIRQRHFNTKI